MMDIKIEFIKDKFQVTKESGHKFYLDAKEEGIEGVYPNPIELLLSSLGVCVGIYAKKYLRSAKIDFNVLEIALVSVISKEAPLRVSSIGVNILTDAELRDRKDAFLTFVNKCLIHNTLILPADIKISLKD